jgi:ABC-type transport system substrate-binding protein
MTSWIPRKTKPPRPFAPLPDVFFTDPKAFADHPIGNGPMKFVSRTPNVDIKLTRFDDYQVGPAAALRSGTPDDRAAHQRAAGSQFRFTLGGVSTPNQVNPPKVVTNS